jgi:copper(I)-binding protein
MTRTLTLVFAMLLALGSLFAAPAARGFDHGSGTPEAGHDEMSGTPVAGHDEMSMTGTGAAFMVIDNAGAEDDVLLSGETDVAQVVEIHEMADANGVMVMRPLADGLTIPAGSEAILEPGGYHVMLIGLTEDLTNGMTFDLTLKFAQAGEVTVPVMVRRSAELAADATPAAPVTVGDITISDPWSRPAPATGMGDMTKMATPHS